MSVYIKDLEFPKPEDKYYYALIIHPNGKCYRYRTAFGALTVDAGEYEAVPVPPHGDLIDKDATMNEILEQRGEDTACWFAGIVNDMTAIIPSDKAEEGEA